MAKKPEKTLTPRERADAAVERRNKYRTCSAEARAIAERLDKRLHGPNAHTFYENLISTKGHATKHMSSTGPQLLDDMLYDRIGANHASRNHVNGFQDEESAEYDIVDGIVLAKYEIAAWLNGEHETPANRRLEIYIPDVNRREDLDDDGCLSLAGPAFARTSDDICLAESAGMWLILDPRSYDRESFDVVTAYPDVVPGVSRNVPADVTKTVAATEYYKRGDDFTKAILEYMARDKPEDRPRGFLTKDKRSFMIPVDADRDGAKLAVRSDGTIQFVPSLADRERGARTATIDAANERIRDKQRARFPAAFDVAAGLQARVDELSGFTRQPLSRRPVERKTLARGRDRETASADPGETRVTSEPSRTATPVADGNAGRRKQRTPSGAKRPSSTPSRGPSTRRAMAEALALEDASRDAEGELSRP